MRDVREELMKEKRELEHIIQEAEARLMQAPEGSLQIGSTKEKSMYYLKTANNKKIYLRKSQGQLLQDLAQKQYDEKLVKVAKEQLCVTRNFLSRYQSQGVQDVYSQCHPERKKLIKEYIIDDLEYARIWEEESYIPKKFAEGDGEIYTERGERVRSKSEKIIADKLYAMHIPYKYEAPLEITGYGTIYPDFTVLNVAERKVYYWEHFGMMDDAEYVQKTVKKIDGYIKNHYYAGKELIFTFESKRNPLHTKNLEELIQNYLI